MQQSVRENIQSNKPKYNGEFCYDPETGKVRFVRADNTMFVGLSNEKLRSELTAVSSANSTPNVISSPNIISSSQIATSGIFEVEFTHKGEIFKFKGTRSQFQEVFEIIKKY